MVERTKRSGTKPGMIRQGTTKDGTRRSERLVREVRTKPKLIKLDPVIRTAVMAKKRFSTFGLYLT